MVFIPAIEQASLAEQEQYQYARLLETLQYLHQHSPYYRSMLSAYSISPRDITSLAALQLLPTTSKQDLQTYNMDFLCVAPDAVREYAATSGTLGRPVTIALTGNDLKRLAYNEYLSFHCMGAAPGDIFQLMLTLDRQFMAGIAYYSGLSKLGAAAIRTGPGLPAMQWETIRQLGATGLVTVPSFLLKMLAYAKDHGIFPGHTSVRKVLAIGESLRDADLAGNALARQIGEEWNIELYGTYASTEMQTAFTECAAGQGGHHHPELIITELLDDAGQAAAPETIGEVTITTLGVEGMPLLRYRTGDMCKAYYTPCSCGRTTMRLGPVLGRKQQMIKFKGTTLYPPAIFDVLDGLPAITGYVVVVESGSDEQDMVALHLHTNLLQEDCDVLLKPIFRHKWRVTPQLIYRTEEDIRKMQFPGDSRKPVKFLDNRAQQHL